MLIVHDIFVLTNPEWYSRRYVWSHAPMLRAQIKSAAAVVAVSDPVATQLKTRRLRKDEIAVAPNAPAEMFRKRPAGDDNDALSSRGLHIGRYLLSVGSRDPRKNLSRLAKAYSALNSEERMKFPLVLIGAGSDVFRVEQIPWPAGVIDAGFVSDDELRQFYRHARSVVFVSQAEGFGIPIVEAAASGARGLLVSDIDVFHWICGNRARYVDPLSVDAITRALRAEIEDPQDEELDLERFTWDSSAAVIASVCRQVVRGS